MELFQEILIKVFEKQEITVLFPNLKINAVETVEIESYKALQKIKAIVENNSLSDKECFMRIEEIVCVLEDIGSDGGSRHDFG